MRTLEHGELLRSLNDKEDLTVFEVLPMSYFEQGHIPGAIQSNSDEISMMVKKLGLSKKAKIVTYCASKTCPNSHRAAEILSNLGYSNVFVFAGGKQTWVDAGLTLSI